MSAKREKIPIIRILTFHISVIGRCPAEQLIQMPCQLYILLIYKIVVDFNATRTYSHLVNIANEWLISS